jgi:CDP-diacylglycerol pyrophosphatase
VSADQEADYLRRRQFVRLAGVAGAAAVVAGVVPAATDGAAAACGQADLCGNASDTSPELWRTAKSCGKAYRSGMPMPPECHGTTATYVVLKGRPSTDHNFLLVPTRRVKGIECPYIWSASAPNYWLHAWGQAQPGGAGPVKYPAGIGLGINSAQARQQDQLHIHMAGILSDVQGQLGAAKNITADPKKWADSIVSVKGIEGGKTNHRYYRALHAATLDHNLFALLRDNVPAAKKDMSTQTIIVTKRSAGGFYVLNSDPGLTGPVHGQGGTGTCDYLLVYT